MSDFWNPWHGCTRISPGCLNCYVYRIDRQHDKAEESSFCRRTASFDLPLKKNRKGEYKIPPGSRVYTCFTSDFFIPDADGWRDEAWDIIRRRRDCVFLFYTKRIERWLDCIPDDWGDGYDNVIIGCTVENQKMAEKRLPEFLSAPVKHRIIGVEPMLERIDLSGYLCYKIEEVSVGGESGNGARVCDFDWVLDIRRQCAEKGISFYFHQTGSRFRKDGRIYNIPRKLQIEQARKAGIDLI
ncbi:MAG: DUF5131 family protein [Clostridia bacterium]|nr:DUF5131 family protein [Clostridia bacterium]